jgi:hypothetical protein
MPDQRLLQLIQNTPEWADARAPLSTASGIAKSVITPAKLQLSKSEECRAYAHGIAWSRRTGKARYNPDGFWLRRGHELEPVAIGAYEAVYEQEVQRVGIWTSDELPMVSCSPDGVIGWDGSGPPEKLIQVKCFSEAKHVEMVLSSEPDRETWLQMQIEYWVTKAKDHAIVLFEPILFEHEKAGWEQSLPGFDWALGCWEISVARDDAAQEIIGRHIREFDAMVADVCRRLDAMRLDDKHPF